MDNTVPYWSRPVKHTPGAAAIVECATIDIFLQALFLVPAYLMPLVHTSLQGVQGHQRFALHLTGQPDDPHGPVYFATFVVAEMLGLGQAATLTFPYRGTTTRATETLQLARELQHQALAVLATRLTSSGRISQVFAPARYTLPDDLVWAAASRSQGFVYRQGRWQFEEVSS